MHTYGLMAMWLVWIVLGAGLIALLVWIVYVMSRSAAPRSDDAAERILKERLASGEIDEAEYERRLTELRR